MSAVSWYKLKTFSAFLNTRIVAKNQRKWEVFAHIVAVTDKVLMNDGQASLLYTLSNKAHNIFVNIHIYIHMPNKRTHLKAKHVPTAQMTGVRHLYIYDSYLRRPKN